MQKKKLFASNFEILNFASNEVYSKKQIDNPNYCVVIVIFQR